MACVEGGGDERRQEFWLIEFFFNLKVKQKIHLKLAQTILYRLVYELSTIKVSPEEYPQEERSQ